MASQAQSSTQPRMKAWLIIIHVAAKFPTLALLECSRELQSQTPGTSYAAQHSPSVWLPVAVIARTLSSTYIPLRVFSRLRHSRVILPATVGYGTSSSSLGYLGMGNKAQFSLLKQLTP